MDLIEVPENNIPLIAAELKIKNNLPIKSLKTFATLPKHIQNNFLLTAIGHNSTIAIAWCIKHGADPNYISTGGSPLAHALYFYKCGKCAKTLVENGARVIHRNGGEHLLFQAIDAYIKRDTHTPKVDSDFIKQFIIDVLNVLPHKELITLRSSIGQTPYMVAKLGGLPDDLLAEIETKTKPKNANKNIYGRTLAAYEKYKTRGMQEVTSTIGGRRKMTRRVRRNKRAETKKSRKSRR